MKLLLSAFLLANGAQAFAPARFGARVGTARKFGADPSMFHDLPNHVDTLREAFSTMSLADAMDAVPAMPDIPTVSITA